MWNFLCFIPREFIFEFHYLLYIGWYNRAFWYLMPGATDIAKNKQKEDKQWKRIGKKGMKEKRKETIEKLFL